MSDYNAYLARRSQQTTTSVPFGTGTVQTLHVHMDRLVSIHGSMVPLSALRAALSGTRESQDATIQAARYSCLYCLEPAEGRYGIPSDLAAAAYTDQHGTYHYISRRD